jgi:hypothetical protein
VLSAVDRADTRSWQTLPAEIQVFRMEYRSGEGAVSVQYLDANGDVRGTSATVNFSTGAGNKTIVFVI